VLGLYGVPRMCRSASSQPPGAWAAWPQAKHSHQGAWGRGIRAGLARPQGCQPCSACLAQRRLAVPPGWMLPGSSVCSTVWYVHMWSLVQLQATGAPARDASRLLVCPCWYTWAGCHRHATCKQGMSGVVRGASGPAPAVSRVAAVSTQQREQRQVSHPAPVVGHLCSNMLFRWV
jgi:hypothetical protein